MNASEDVAHAIHCPRANVEANWPKVQAALEAVGAGSEPSQLAALATIAVESAWSFEPIKEFGSEAYLTAKPYYPYFGRGFGQITWEDAYRKYGQVCGVDLIAQPDLACDPDNSAKIFAAQWRDKQCHILAAMDDWRHVRIRWNGGTNGMDEFLACVTRLQALQAAQTVAVADLDGEISV